MTEPTTDELSEFFRLGSLPTPHPTDGKFAALAKRIAPKLEALLARQDAELESLRNRPAKANGKK